MSTIPRASLARPYSNLVNASPLNRKLFNLPLYPITASHRETNAFDHPKKPVHLPKIPLLSPTPQIFFCLSPTLSYVYRGLYVPDDDRWPSHFRGLNIRIEDSVCVQAEHPLVLTTEAVKEVCGSIHLHLSPFPYPYDQRSFSPPKRQIFKIQHHNLKAPKNPKTHTKLSCAID
jgi:hypothetical protein